MKIKRVFLLGVMASTLMTVFTLGGVEGIARASVPTVFASNLIADDLATRDADRISTDLLVAQNGEEWNTKALPTSFGNVGLEDTKKMVIAKEKKAKKKAAKKKRVSKKKAAKKKKAVKKKSNGKAKGKAKGKKKKAKKKAK